MLSYEAPAIEREISSEEVEREVHYAGSSITIIPG